jgi:hypothetical protein
MKKIVRATVLAGALLAPVLVFPATADAAVSSCATQYFGQTGELSCKTTGSSQYRAKINCARLNGNGSVTVYGKWTSKSQWSVGTCPEETELTGLVKQVR